MIRPLMNFNADNSILAETPLKSTELVHLVCFRFADEEYAIEMTKVREVIRLQSITHVPQMPPTSLGIINIRGSIVPVFDIRLLLGLPITDPKKKSRIIVFLDQDQMVSFVVDEVLENIKLFKDKIDPAPSVKTRIETGCIQGIGKLGGRMIAILNMERIHAVIKSTITS